MAKDSGGKKGSSKLPAEPSQDEKLRMRQELGIQGLPEGEELMNTATFSRVHIDRVLEARRLDEGASLEDDEPMDELVLEKVATELPVRGLGRRPDTGPPADPVEVAALEREMMSAKERDEVAELALRIATYYAKAAALFVVHRGLVAGLRSAGEGLSTGIEAVMIPADSESVICRPIETGKLARGGESLGAVDERVLKAMGRSDASEMLVLPVPIGDRVVNLLYADNGDATLPDTSVGALRVLALGVAKAYERLIFERKDGGEPDAA
jgi:hypothetical protein